MLPKLQRLPHSLRLKSARSLYTEFFIVKTVPNDVPVSRFGVVISKKVDKRAVVRNRMRRLIHHAVGIEFAQVAGTRDTLFIVQKSFAEISEDVMQQVIVFLKKG